MSVAATAPAAYLPRAAGGLERLRLGLLWITGAASALVFMEPSPYEFASLAAIAVFALTGLKLRPAFVPLLFLLILLNIGYTIAANPYLRDSDILTWVAVSWFLAATSLFFAAMLQINTQARLDALMRGVLIAGIVAALAGVLGYFRLMPGGSDWLVLYDRARGTFKDPNVFGAFLILPALIVLQRMLGGGFKRTVGAGLLLALFTAGVLLSFSRAAWGQLVLSGGLVLFLSFVTTPSPYLRMRVVLLTAAGVGAMVLLLAGLLSVDTVANLMEQRFSLSQSYDVGEQGRFGRQVDGAIMALEKSLGLGPLQFAKYFPEDPHNTYLNTFISGGWLAGLSYAALTFITLVFGLKPVFVRTPWQPAAIVIYSAYVGVAAESVIIDTDHWRHAFLLLGIQWGLIAATYADRDARRRLRVLDAAQEAAYTRTGARPAAA